MTRVLTFLALAAALVLGVSAPASAGVDDFYIDSFDGHYTLSVDDEGHSQLTTVETLVAVFPDFDQNRGIRRLLVDRFDGHPTDIVVQSVTDENGTPRHYETDGDDDFLLVAIADEDVYVHGAQTYVITYTQRNVTKYFADTDSDEFYWDTNGHGWSQLFGSVTATVEIDPELRERLNGKAHAASGFEGEHGPATVVETQNGYRFEAGYLAPGQNLTFAIGFEPGTFTEREGGFFAGASPTVALVCTLLGVLVLGFAVRLRATRLADAAGRPTIVAEYLPPKKANVLVASALLGKQGKATVAGILKLAVSGNLRVLQEPGTKPHYALQFVTADGTDAREREFLEALFGSRMSPGQTLPLRKANAKAAERVSALMARVRADVVSSGFRRKDAVGLIALTIALASLSAVGAFVAAVVAIEEAYGGWWPAILLATAVASAFTSILLVARRPLTAAGAELRDHLRGLDVYIRLAEADRIRYLQSAQGAERTAVAAGPRSIVDLNERLLPYAVVFGHEKQWLAELGHYYEQLGEQPNWFAGQGAFNAAVFSSGIGAMATSAASTYSSSAGGSAGGASSGGGGGGGGGGGI